jgi:acyl-CoA oxidase
MELLLLCCAMKTQISWHAENSATTSRERCGGQGFLAANRLGEGIVGGHAGITAEGDNSVLMQKIAKELLGLADKKKVAKQMFVSYLPSIVRRTIHGTLTGKLSDHKFLLRLLKVRESQRLSELAVSLNQNKKKGKSLFEVWMYEESDLIQGLAQAHSDRVIFEACVDTLGSCEEGLKPILTQLLLLTAIDWIEKDLGWFVSQKVITSRLGTKIPEYGRKLCAQIAPSAIQLIDAFGIPEHMRHAPISGDWIKYNQTDNFGELLPEMQNLRNTYKTR